MMKKRILSVLLVALMVLSMLPTSVFATGEPAEGYIAVYFVDEAGLDTVRCFAFSSTPRDPNELPIVPIKGTGKLDEWPGVTLETIGNDRNGKAVYRIDVSILSYDNVVFTDGNGWQTVDLPFVADAKADDHIVYFGNSNEADQDGHYKAYPTTNVWAIQSETEPTCLEAGVITLVSLVTGETETETGTAALGHNWSAWTHVENSDPSQHKRTCSRCQLEQTADCTFENNTCTVCGFSPVAPEPPEPEYITVYYVDENDMEAVYAYAFFELQTSTDELPVIPVNDEEFHEWPGQELQSIGLDRNNHKVYKIDLNIKRFNYVIFNNGSSAKQTVNLPFENDAGENKHVVYFGYSQVDAQGHYEPSKADNVDKLISTVQPTCTEAGTYLLESFITGQQHSETFGQALGHDFDDWTQSKAATCTEKGEDRRDCSRCDVFETREVPALGHDFAGEWTVTTAPTCTEEGVESQKCSRCDATQTRPVDALGHNWDEGVVTTQPTITQEGVKTFTCKRCNATKTEAVPRLGTDTTALIAAINAAGEIDRDLYRAEGLAALDTALAAAQAALANDTLTQEQADAAAANLNAAIAGLVLKGKDVTIYVVDQKKSEALYAWAWTEGGAANAEAYPGVLLTDPQNDKDGNPFYSFVLNTVDYSTGLIFNYGAGQAQTENIDWVADAGEGTTLVYYLNDSEGSLKAYKGTDVWPESSKVAVSATCTEAGSVKYTGLLTGEELTETVAALGHDLGEWAVFAAPNCTEKGEERRTCSRCDYYESNELEALGHTWNEGEVTTAPTLTQEGVMSYTCTVCGAKKTEAIEKLPAVDTAALEAEIAAAKAIVRNDYTAESLAALDAALADAEAALISNVLTQEAANAATEALALARAGLVLKDAILLPVYVVDENDFATLKYYAFHQEEPIVYKAEWPGEGMLLLGTDRNGHKVYKVNIDTSRYDYVIFNNGADWQTVNLGYLAEANQRDLDYIVFFLNSNEADAQGHYKAWPTTDVWKIKEEKAATCLEAGSITLESFVTGNTEIEAGAAALGHDFGDWTQSKAATCTEKGEDRRDCSRCDVFETREVPALGHDFAGEWTVTTAPTCTEEGVESQKCSRCDATQTRPVNALGHDWDDGVVTTQPTITQEGVKTFTCKRCNATKTEAVSRLGTDTAALIAAINAAGEIDRDLYRAEGLAALDTALAAAQAALANDTLTQEQADAAAANLNAAIAGLVLKGKDVTIYVVDQKKSEALYAWAWTEGGAANAEAYPGVLLTDPQNDKDGNPFYSFALNTVDYSTGLIFNYGAGQAQTEDIDWVADAGEGTTLVYYLNDSEGSLKAYKGTDVWPESSKVAVGATCTEAGSVKYTGLLTGEELTETVAALGHDLGEWAVFAAPNCTEKGEERRTCSRCDYYESNELAALGHTWNEGEVTTAPTLTQEGVMSYTCTVCGAKKTEAIEKLPAVDTAALEAEIAAAKAIVRNDYTAESLALMDAALAEAETALASDTLTQEAANAAANALKNAIANLIRKDATPMAVYYVDEVGLGALNYYTFNSANGTYKTVWPGETLAPIGQDRNNKNVYLIQIDTGRFDSVIFNNGGNWQTQNLCFVTDAAALEIGYVVYFGNANEADEQGHYKAYPTTNVWKIQSETEPTCLEAGVITLESLVTGNTETEPGAAALGHNWGAWAHVADSDPSQHSRKCSRCELVETEACTFEDGTCTVCGYTNQQPPEPPTPIPMGVYFVDENDFETVNYYAFGDSGEKAAWPGEAVTQIIGKDRNNHNVYKIEIDAALYHTVVFNNGDAWQTVNLSFIMDAASFGLNYVVYFGNSDEPDEQGHYQAAKANDVLTLVSSTPATCTEPESLSLKSLINGKPSVETGEAALGHNWSDWAHVADSDPSQHSRKCSRCELVETEACTFEDGTCTVCGYTLPAEPIPMTVYFVDENDFATINYYAFGNNGEKAAWPGEALEAIGQDRNGHNVYKFEIDAAQYHTVIFNNGDDWQTVDLSILTDAAALELDGYIVYFGNSNETDGQGHYKAYPTTNVWKIKSETEPTCLEAGVITLESFVTGATETETGEAALGHNWSDWAHVADSDPSQHSRKCSRCELVETEACTFEDGTCTVCGYTLPAEPIPMTVYFVDENDFAAINYYAFGNNGEKAAWPGEALEAIGQDRNGHNVYKFEIDAAQYHTVIFNNGDDWQTVDLSILTDAAALELDGYIVYFGNTNEADEQGHYRAYPTTDVWKIQSETPATCTEAGQIVLVSFVTGNKETETVLATGHTPGEPEQINVVEPTCTTAGGYDTVIKCTVCQTVISSQHTDVPATGHAWGEPTYTWSDDNSEVTGLCVCRYDASHTLSETVLTTSEVTKPATYEEEGELTYTAVFTKEQFTTQTKTVAIPKLVITFVDVPDGAFYKDAVDWAVEMGITKGKDATHFAPNDVCTRGQVVTFLWRAVGSPEPTSTGTAFTDVQSSKYYYKAVLWAVENGITTGKNATTFGPDDPCTRGQVVTFLWRAENKPEPSSLETSFTDVKETGYYYKAMCWAVENGITNGLTKTTFGPDKECTRGQIVTFLYRDLAN